jgi:hypothetical protein
MIIVRVPMAAFRPIRIARPARMCALKTAPSLSSKRTVMRLLSFGSLLV